MCGSGAEEYRSDAVDGIGVAFVRKFIFVFDAENCEMNNHVGAERGPNFHVKFRSDSVNFHFPVAAPDFIILVAGSNGIVHKEPVVGVRLGCR